MFGRTKALKARVDQLEALLAGISAAVDTKVQLAEQHRKDAQAAVDALDIESEVESYVDEALRNFDFEDAIENAVRYGNVADVIADNIDIERAVEDALESEGPFATRDDVYDAIQASLDGDLRTELDEHDERLRTIEGAAVTSALIAG